MKKTFKIQAIRMIAGITVMLAAIAFSMAACSDDSGGSGSGGGGGGGSGKYTFTLTGIPPEYNGMHANCSAQSANCAGFSDSFDIANGRVSMSFPLLQLTPSDGPGNETYKVVVYIYEILEMERDSVEWSGDFDSVRFSNGSATRSWSEGY